jgi:hypothetical protein
MSFLPDELQMDDTIDTTRMAPEDDFASPADMRVPRKAPNQTFGDGASAGDSYYGAAPRGQQYAGSNDFEAHNFQHQSNMPNAFTQTPIDQRMPAQQWQPPELVGDIDEGVRPTPQGHYGQQAPQYQIPQAQDDQSGEDEGFAPELLAAAGLTEEEALQDFGSPEALQSAVRMLDTRFVSEGRQAMQAEALHPQEDITPGDAEEWNLPTPEGSDDWDEDTRRLVGAMGDQFKSMLSKRDEQIKVQQEILQQQIQDQQRRAMEQELAEFESMVNSLPDSYTPFLGVGETSSFRPGSMQLNNRLHLGQTMDQLQAGNRMAGRSPIPKEELMIRSLAIAFPEAHTHAIRQEVTQEIGQRRQMMTQRPTQRREGFATGEQKAGQTAEDWYRKHNLSYDEMDDYQF